MQYCKKKLIEKKKNLNFMYFIIILKINFNFKFKKNRYFFNEERNEY